MSQWWKQGKRRRGQQAAPSLAAYTLSSGSYWFLSKTSLAIVGVLVVLAGAWGLYRSNHTTVFAPGRLATAHSLFQNDCLQCHEQAWHNVADAACQSCHVGPRHHDNQVRTPSCATCHREHRGPATVLSAVKERTCTQCHADLKDHAKVPPHFATAVQSFVNGHPEFAITVQKPKLVKSEKLAKPVRVRFTDTASLYDAAQIRLNHAMHLQANLLGPQGFEQLVCASCHQPDAQGAYMQPIVYEDHCQRCHSLDFDPRFPQHSVPHTDPAMIHTFLMGTFTQYFLQPGQTDSDLANDDRADGDLADSDPDQAPVRRRPGQVGQIGQVGQAEQAQHQQLSWPLRQRIEWHVEETERFLFDQVTCKTCHTLAPTAGSRLPRIEAPAIPQRWLPHSVFNHQAHARAELSCEHCHDTAKQSRHTRDVLLPHIAVCQDCHSPVGGVRFECMTCHLYHDRDQISLVESGYAPLTRPTGFSLRDSSSRDSSE